jgi:hypothetical protein
MITTGSHGGMRLSAKDGLTVDCQFGVWVGHPVHSIYSGSTQKSKKCWQPSFDLCQSQRGSLSYNGVNLKVKQDAELAKEQGNSSSWAVFYHELGANENVRGNLQADPPKSASKVLNNFFPPSAETDSMSKMSRLCTCSLKPRVSRSLGMTTVVCQLTRLRAKTSRNGPKTMHGCTVMHHRVILPTSDVMTYRPRMSTSTSCLVEKPPSAPVFAIWASPSCLV